MITPTEIQNRKDKESWKRLYSSVDDSIKVEEKIIQLKSQLKLSAWLRMYFVTDADFDKPQTLPKPFNTLRKEYEEMYQKAFGKPTGHYYPEDFKCAMMWERRKIRKEIFGEDWELDMWNSIVKKMEARELEDWEQKQLEEYKEKITKRMKSR